MFYHLDLTDHFKYSFFWNLKVSMFICLSDSFEEDAEENLIAYLFFELTD